MRKEIVRSLVVLFTIVSGIIAAFSLGVTELIKYVMKDYANSMGRNLELDKMMLGNISITMGELKDNLGWGFLALMFLGILIIIAMHFHEMHQKRESR